jgi:hypothetical protein
MTTLLTVLIILIITPILAVLLQYWLSLELTVMQAYVESDAAYRKRHPLTRGQANRMCKILKLPKGGHLSLCLLFAVTLALPHAAHAADWLCTEESSIRDDAGIHACGIGVSEDEDEARGLAFNHAKAEFNRVCQDSEDCKDRKLTVSPGRTTCALKNGSFTCHRIVTFTPGEPIDPAVVAVNTRQLNPGLECDDDCNSQHHECRGQGALWAWNHGCVDAYQRPFN